jgi:hypothetical protein
MPRVREWAAELDRRRDEVLATLSDEGVVVESVFLDRVGGDDVLVYYVKARDAEAAARAVRRSRHDVDAYHAAFKRDTWDERTPLELLVDFENLPES